MLQHNWSGWWQSSDIPDTFYRYCLSNGACCAKQLGVQIEIRNHTLRTTAKMSDAIEVAAAAGRSMLTPEEFAGLMEMANALRKLNS